MLSPLLLRSYNEVQPTVLLEEWFEMQTKQKLRVRLNEQKIRHVIQYHEKSRMLVGGKTDQWTRRSNHKYNREALPDIKNVYL